MADKGADLALLLGGPEMESLDEGGDDYDAAFADAADAAFSALKSGDKGAFSEHLKDAIHICLEHNPGPVEEEEY